MQTIKTQPNVGKLYQPHGSLGNYHLGSKKPCNLRRVLNHGPPCSKPAINGQVQIPLASIPCSFATPPCLWVMPFGAKMAVCSSCTFCQKKTRNTKIWYCTGPGKGYISQDIYNFLREYHHTISYNHLFSRFFRSMSHGGSEEGIFTRNVCDLVPV